LKKLLLKIIDITFFRSYKDLGMQPCLDPP